jgi:hypothetical protein
VAFDSGGSEDALRRKGHIPNLARQCLRDLQEAGLHTVWRSEDSGDLRLVHLESGPGLLDGVWALQRSLGSSER